MIQDLRPKPARPATGTASGCEGRGERVRLRAEAMAMQEAPGLEAGWLGKREGVPASLA
jgi:hypothetical protein